MAKGNDLVQAARAMGKLEIISIGFETKEKDATGLPAPVKGKRIASRMRRTKKSEQVEVPLTKEVLNALVTLNKDNPETWSIRRAAAYKSDGRMCWRVENAEGFLRAEIHDGGDVERHIYASAEVHSARGPQLEDLARALWAVQARITLKKRARQRLKRDDQEAVSEALNNPLGLTGEHDVVIEAINQHVAGE
jgi:hypothetical protein